jgi:hypothetical protein
MGSAVAGLDYEGSPAPVRDDLRDAHRFLLDHIRAPGTWWTGTERVAIAAESRAAARCALCDARKESLSPGALAGRHDGPGTLGERVIDAIHRIRTDPARLSKHWFDHVTAALNVERYVELVGVTTLTAGLDYFARALGVDPLPLPSPLPGEPSRYRPAGTKSGTAWVPMIAPEDATGPEADLYGDAEIVPNIVRALSLVPPEVRALRRSSDAHYVPVAKIGDPTVRRALERPQIELVAARVSALNECFY